MMWTRAKGPVCDFQLRGYGSGEEIAFEDGKRCNLSGEQSRYDDSSQERATIDETMRAMIGDERGAWHQMDRVKDSLISKLSSEQERLFANLDKTTRAAPQLIEDARGVLERALEFQQHHFEDYVSRAGGQRELEAKAFAEYQKTRRTDALFAFLKDGVMALGAAIPAAVSVFEEVTGRDTTVPKFECVQQALAYLALSFNPERLSSCFAGAPNVKLERAREALQIFDRLSKQSNELQVLLEVEPLIRFLLNGEQFRQAANPEERIAARFIVGRAAVLRVAFNHEDEA